MNPLIQLPKTACLEIGGYALRIENHKVTTDGYGLLLWIISVDRHYNWDEIIQQMISRGFKLGAVIEYCIAELQDTELFAWIMRMYLADPTQSSNRSNYAESKQGKTTAEKFINELKTCRNWDQFYKIIHYKSDFQKNIKQEIREGYKVCVNL